jgi:hypothetical protein
LIGIPPTIVIIPKIIILQLIINQKGFCSHCSSAELHMRRCQNTSFSASHGFHGPDSGLFAWLSMDWFKNLQETMVFTIKYRGFPVNFPIIQFYEVSTFWGWLVHFTIAKKHKVLVSI